MRRSACLPWLLVLGCSAGGEEPDLAAPLPGAEVELESDGVPTFISGDLGRASGGKLDAEGAGEALPKVLARIAPVFKLAVTDLRLIEVTTDPDGALHARYRQTQYGLDVEGAELMVHVDAQGVVYAVNGTARGGDNTPSMMTTIDADEARRRLVSSGDYRDLQPGAPQLAFVFDDARELRLAWEIEVTGERAGAEDDSEPVDDRVFIDARTGAVAAVVPQVHSGRNRRITSAGNGKVIPGFVRLNEGEDWRAPVDSSVRTLYDNIGATWDCYSALFNRDSYDAKGGRLTGVLHFGVNTNNAYSKGGGVLAFGDGDGVRSGPWGDALDIVAHEATHAVTGSTAALRYVNESGAINESMSDVFGAVCESWKRGKIDAQTWMIGEDLWTPAQAGDALRHMNDPAADGDIDFYPDRYIGPGDHGGVHSNSGIGNLAFKLLVSGGRHPRQKSTTQVPALGMEKARRIFYRALTRYLTSTSQYKDLRAATMFAAKELYGTPERTAVQAAWDAVGVDSTGPAAPRSSVSLGTGGERVISGKTDEQTYYAIDVPAGTAHLIIETRGGSGDVDLHLKRGVGPTPHAADLSSTGYRTNDEVLSLVSPVAGRYYLLATGAKAYDHVTLTVWSAPAVQTPVLSNGRWHAFTAPAGTAVRFSFEAPSAGAALLVELEGEEGDADLFVKRGAVPTRTSNDAASATADRVREAVHLEPGAGTYHIAVDVTKRPKTARIRATFYAAATALENGTTTTITAAAGPPRLYSLEVPSGAKTLEVELSGGSTDADLYLQSGQAPTNVDHEAASSGEGPDELIVQHGVVPGRVYVAVYGNGPLDGARLTARHSSEAPATRALVNGRNVRLLLAPGSSWRFSLDVPASVIDGTFSVGGGVDLFVRRGTPPTSTSFEHGTMSGGTGIKNLNVAPMGSGTFHLLVEGKQSGPAWVNATYQGTPDLREGRDTFLSAGRGAWRILRFEAPTGTRGVTFTVDGGDGDADLYVKKGGVPTVAAHDAKSENAFNQETVWLASGAGTYYAMLMATDEFAMAKVKVTVQK